MRCLNPASVPPGKQPPTGWRLLPALQPARRALEAHRPGIVRLAHALGGSPAWFRVHASPRLLQWEALVAGLPALPGDGSGRLSRLTAFAQVLGSAAAAAESEPEPPMHRLGVAHRAALFQAWHCVCGLVVHDAAGRTWQPGREDCRGWRAAAPGPQGCHARRSAPGPTLPAAMTVLPEIAGLESAVLDLHRRRVWCDDGRCGRWLACAQGWTLLWPLAGRDLQRALGTATPLSRVIQALRQAGFSPPGHGVMTASRHDGRAVLVLPVTARLRKACGLSPGLPAQPALCLTGKVQDQARGGLP